MHPAIISSVRSSWTWLLGRYHVPQNVFLVLTTIIVYRSFKSDIRLQVSCRSSDFLSHTTASNTVVLALLQRDNASVNTELLCDKPIVNVDQCQHVTQSANTPDFIHA